MLNTRSQRNRGCRRKSSEQRKTTHKQDPRLPSEQERIEHEMMHLLFRSWSRHCIKGREREENCFKATEEERHVQCIHLDYMFMGDEKEGKTSAFWWPEKE